MNRLFSCTFSVRKNFINSAIRIPASNQYHIQSRVTKLVTSVTTNYPVICRLFHSAKLLKYCFNQSQNVNTNLLKDVIIYKYENPKFFKYMNIFAYCQFLFWAYLSNFAYTELRDRPVDPNSITEDTPFWKKINLGESKYRTGFAIFCFTFGMEVHVNKLYN